MNKLKLSTQMNIMFSIITLLGALIFIFILNVAFTKGFEQQNATQLDEFYEEIKNTYLGRGVLNMDYESEFNDYILIEDETTISYSKNFLTQEQVDSITEDIVVDYFIKGNDYYYEITYERLNGIAFQGEVIDSISSEKFAIIAVSNVDYYIQKSSGNVPLYASLAFLNILVLGNIMIWLWSGYTVQKMIDLQQAVKHMSDDNYVTPIRVEGAQEIEALATSIDQMREEIKQNDQTKKEMIQNISHDFKTPIAVIKSYAEAIQDGVTDKSEAHIIIKQADILNERVKQLIELNKIGYLKIEGNLKDISMKETIHQIIDHYKYLTDAKVTLDLKSDWMHPMIPENFYIAVSNIVDNMIRYVKTKLTFTLEKEKLTIFNDGEPIDEAFIPKMFNAYEKSSKGQFGLGLAITKQTLERFGLNVYAKNVDGGVAFIIEPL